MTYDERTRQSKKCKTWVGPTGNRVQLGSAQVPRLHKSGRIGDTADMALSFRKSMTQKIEKHHRDYRPDAPDVVDLDAVEEHSGVPAGSDQGDAITKANFIRVDRGPERKGVIPVHRF